MLCWFQFAIYMSLIKNLGKSTKVCNSVQGYNHIFEQKGQYYHDVHVVPYHCLYWFIGSWLYNAKCKYIDSSVINFKPTCDYNLNVFCFTHLQLDFFCELHVVINSYACMVIWQIKVIIWENYIVHHINASKFQTL